MSSPFVIPFNFQPASVSVQSGSYSIPAGNYARVTVNIDGTGTFTIGGTTALSSTEISVLSTTSLRMGFTTTDALHTVGGQSGGPAATTSATDKKSVTATYFLPTGTAINGTGTWRAVVELYNMIT